MLNFFCACKHSVLHLDNIEVKLFFIRYFLVTGENVLNT